MPYAKATDQNQAIIVEALRKAGRSVQLLHTVGKGCPDLLVGNHGRNYLLEIKIKKGTLTPHQKEWMSTWRGSYAIVRTVEEAISATEQE